MIHFAPGVSNRLWLLRSLEPWRAFQAAAADPRAAQVGRLRSILRWNAASEYGRRFGFGSIRTVEEFQRRLPAVRFDDLTAEVEAIRKGREGVLTTEPTLMLQPSSGSTAATKLIPYTASLRRELGRAVSVWIGDLFWNRPHLMDGPAYWSISPLSTVGPREASDSGGSSPGRSPVRVGFDDDAAYLGGIARSIVTGALAVPGEVGKIPDIEAHRYATLRFLLAEPEVRIISVWSPTFLALLLEPLTRWWDRLVEDVGAGTLSFPVNGGSGKGAGANDAPSGGEEGGALGGFDYAGVGLRPPASDPRRARELRAAGPEDLPGIWPGLGLLSAWADGASAPYADDLRRSFPGIPFQPKGLIATEAFVSIPRWTLPGAHPAITSHFLEFVPEGAGAEDALLVDALSEGERYEILVTTGGGLYRYRLGDLVEVVGTAGGLPCLRFAGRSDRVSDRFGEKLSDGFVTRALQGICAEEDLEPRFSLLAPEEDGGRVRYVWYVDPGHGEGECGPGYGPSGGTAREGLARRLDEALSDNFHYANCRRLGQLEPAELRWVPSDAPFRYLEAKRDGGRRLGDVKIPALETEPGWGVLLRGWEPGSPPSAAGRRPRRPGAPAAAAKTSGPGR